ncbi:MAG: hypothetical protein JO362_02220 [Streptomycetaceae bacterium]|nr:hypothetical protein [Streptomycetaceae bacterium]
MTTVLLLSTADTDLPAARASAVRLFDTLRDYCMEEGLASEYVGTPPREHPRTGGDYTSSVSGPSGPGSSVLAEPLEGVITA